MPQPPPQILLDWLIARYPTAKRQTLKRMVEAGRVTINGQAARRLRQPIGETDLIKAADAPARGERNATPQVPPELKIIYEDADLLVVDKPAGLLTATVARERRPTLWAIAKAYVAEREPRARVGLIHRLDRDASGILVFSKNDTAYQSLKTQFFHHDVHREYAALVQGRLDPPAGRIESHLVERADGTVYSTRQFGKGQRAVTEYQTVRIESGKSLLKVVLHTGRKHQIRVHLSQRDCPILGDSVYGQAHTAPRLMLAAVKLVLRHPRDGREMTFEIESPVGL